MRKNLVFDLSFFTLLFVLDRLTKYFSYKFLASKIKYLGIVNLRFVKNTGGIFGLGRNLSFLWVIISIIIFSIFLYWYLKEKDSLSKIYRMSYVFILEGAFSNILDRILYGYVIDFIDFKVWPVFNLSDTLISLGLIIFIFRIWGEKRNKGF